MLLTGCRALALIAVSLGVWSLNLRWGDNAAVGAGPPMQWERQVVGAALLLGVTLMAMLFAGRAGRPPIATRLIALAAAAGALVIAVWLRRDAARGFTGLVEGGGWTFVTVGGFLGLVAAIGYQWVDRAPARATASSSSGGRRRRRR